MLKSGLLNPALASAVARLGHTDSFAIADCGLPIPHGTTIIDLALVFGIPSFEDTLAALLESVVVEGATIATETPAAIRAVLPEVPIKEVTHAQLKAALSEVAFVVRTGSTTPYANVILRSGVAF